MNHSAYCMMIRSTYDLWKPTKPKREKKAQYYRYVETDPIKKKLLATERAAQRKDEKGEFSCDAEIVDWCVKSIKRKKLGDISRYRYNFGDIMAAAIGKVMDAEIKVDWSAECFDDEDEIKHYAGDDIDIGLLADIW